MLEKKEITDKIEILADSTMQIKRAIIILECGTEIGKTYHRHCLVPGDNVSEEDARIKKIATVLWTPTVISAYKASIAVLPS